MSDQDDLAEARAVLAAVDDAIAELHNAADDADDADLPVLANGIRAIGAAGIERLRDQFAYTIGEPVSDDGVFAMRMTLQEVDPDEMSVGDFRAPGGLPPEDPDDWLPDDEEDA